MNKQKRKISVLTSISLFLIISLSIGLGLGLIKNNGNSITSKVQKSSNFFINDLSKQLFLDVFNQDKLELNAYMYDQNNVSDQQLLDLKFALALLNPNRLDTNDDDTIAIMKNNAKKIIFQSLSNN